MARNVARGPFVVTAMAGTAVGLRLTEAERKKRAYAAYVSLRQGILDQKYAPGERLSVEDLARDTGMAAAQVRQAIQRLAADGLVEIRPRSGTYVAGITVEEVEEVCDVRRALECLAAETAVLRISNEQMSRLRMLMHEMNSLTMETEAQRDRHERFNTEFHRVLVTASGNARLIEVYEGLKYHMQFARLHALGRLDWTRSLPEERQEHAMILHALQIRDSDRLKVVLRQHIERAKAAMIAALVTPDSSPTQLL